MRSVNKSDPKNTDAIAQKKKIEARAIWVDEATSIIASIVEAPSFTGTDSKNVGHGRWDAGNERCGGATVARNAIHHLGG